MKKFICSFIIVSLIVMSLGTLMAISNGEYSIDILPDYKSNGMGNYVKDNGDNIGITVSNEKFSNPYTEKNLDMFEKALFEELESVKPQIAEKLKNAYSGMVSEDEIDKMVDSIGIDKIMLKEISTCSKNNYKCFHIISRAKVLEQTFYSNQYVVFSDKSSFVITFTTYAEGEPDYSDFEKMIDSFTIVNYNAPSESAIDWASAVIEGIIIAFLSGIAGFAGVYANKKKKDNTNL